MSAKPFPFKPCYTLAEIDALPPAKPIPRPFFKLGAYLRLVDVIAAWAEAPAFITEADFPRYGIAPFVRPPVEILQPRADDDEWVFRLGGIVLSFLRVQYVVVPKTEIDYDGDDGIAHSRVWGEPRPQSAELLVERCDGVYQVVAEFRWEHLPDAYKRLEAKRRPSAEKLGWSRKDLLELLGDADDE